MSSDSFKRVLVLLAVLTVCFGWIIARPLTAQEPESSVARIEVDPSESSQMIDGFGVNFNGTYFRDDQKAMIDRLLDDLGATIFRLDPYGLTNWETLNDNDDPHVMNWEFYNDRYSIPTFEASWAAARYLNARGATVFMTLSGTVPDWMLDNNAPPPKHPVCNPGPSAKPAHLNPALYGEFAEEAVSMLMYARNRARIKFEYFSPVNETDCYPREGPRVDPQEMPKLLDVIAQRLEKEGMGDIKLVVADQSNATLNYLGPILEDAELMKHVGVFSLHTYGKESVGAQVERIRHSKYPQMPVWLTEYGDLNDRDKSEENEWTHFCLTATRRALRALNQGASAALFWDAYDNYHEHDARLTYYGLMQNADHLYTPKKRYYAAKQLYHFVRPGSQHIASSADSDTLLVSAFRNGAEGALTVVGVKQGGPSHVQVALPKDLPAPARWDLYETTRRVDCLKVDTVNVHDGVAEFELPAEAVFTLIGKIKPGE